MSSGEHNGNPSGEGVGSPTAGEAAGVSGELKGGNLYFRGDSTFLELALDDAEKAVFFAPWKAVTTGMRA